MPKSEIQYTVEMRDKMSSKVGKLNSKIKRLEHNTKKSSKATIGLGSAFSLLGGAAIIAGVVQLGKKVVESTAKFEKMEAVLTTTFGSKSEAKKSMADIVDFASKTPFQVDQLSESFIKLSNRGMKPSMEEMTKLGDLASSVGKPFDQLTEALMDAMTGENERLKEFGIKAKKSGDKVTYTFKGQSTTIKNTEKEIKKYILGLGELKGVTGSMAAISATLEGKLSNLEDTTTQLGVAIGERLKGEINWAVDGLGDLANAALDYAKVKMSDKIFDEKVQLNALVTELNNAETSEARRLELMEEIIKLYPDYFKGLKAEATNIGKITEKAKELNGELDKKRRLQIKTELVDEVSAELKELEKDLNKETTNMFRKLALIAETLNIDLSKYNTIAEQKDVLTRALYSRSDIENRNSLINKVRDINSIKLDKKKEEISNKKAELKFAEKSKVSTSKQIDKEIEKEIEKKEIEKEKKRNDKIESTVGISTLESLAKHPYANFNISFGDFNMENINEEVIKKRTEESLKIIIEEELEKTKTN